VSDAGGRVAQWFLRCAAPFAAMPNWLVVRRTIGWLSARIVPRAVFFGKERLLREERPVILCKMRREKSKRALQAQFAPLDYDCGLLNENHVLALSR
jgi:hypothetical protein